MNGHDKIQSGQDGRKADNKRPTWLGLFGSTEQLTDGTGVLVDENHVRESILEPAAKVTAGYDPIMPTYQGILNEEQIDAILAFMKTLRN